MLGAKTEQARGNDSISMKTIFIQHLPSGTSSRPKEIRPKMALFPWTINSSQPDTYVGG